MHRGRSDRLAALEAAAGLVDEPMVIWRVIVERTPDGPRAVSAIPTVVGGAEPCGCKFERGPDETEDSFRARWHTPSECVRALPG